LIFLTLTKENDVNLTQLSSGVAGHICAVVAFLDRNIDAIGTSDGIERKRDVGSLLLVQVSEHNQSNSQKLDYNLLWKSYQGRLDEWSIVVRTIDTSEGTSVATSSFNPTHAKAMALMDMDELKSYQNICTTILKCAYIVAKSDRTNQESELSFLREIAARYNLNLEAVAKHFSDLGY
jgi:hypothetical protein